MTLSRTTTTRVAAGCLAVAAAVAVGAGPAAASDPAAFKKLKSRYGKLQRKNDPVGQRARRSVLGQFRDFLDQKSCRKLLHKAYDDEKQSLANRCTVVQLLAETGEPKELEWIVKKVGKDASKRNAPRSPSISLGEGLAFAPPASAGLMSAAALKLFGKASDDLQISLLEGVGGLGDSGTTDALAALDTKGFGHALYQRNAAIGSCGRAEAVPFLKRELEAGDPLGHLGAVVGLVNAQCKEALVVLVDLLDDTDPRVVEIAADALREAGHKDAAPALVRAMQGSPLRTKETLRQALAEITGNDFGHDHKAWEKNLGAKAGTVKEPPTPVVFTKFFGIPIPSDRIVVILDTGYWMRLGTRLPTAKAGVERFLKDLPDATQIGLYNVARTLGRSRTGPATLRVARDEAVEWVNSQLRERGSDFLQPLQAAIREHPEADTYVIATASSPRATRPNTSSWETLEVFRRLNDLARIRVHVAFVAPGGRDEKGGENDQAAFDERIDYLTDLAEMTGGTLVEIDR